MEEYARKNDPKLLDLIPKEREWTVKRDHEIINSEENFLELRLGPPGVEEEGKRDEKQSLISLDGHKFYSSVFPGNKQKVLVPYHIMSVMGKESSQPCCTKLVVELQSDEKQTFSPDSANTAVPNTSQKKSAPAPVVGWPPIRSFRKNIANANISSSSKNVVPKNGTLEKKQVESSLKKTGLFVKINMDGVPIGRKVDLKAYDSYQKLSSAVDHLFRGLLAAQRDLSSVGGIRCNEEGEKPITGLLDGSGEYTLVYEDNEGDRMLVGDVPWHMFVSTVKRLRVLKSSELSKIFVGSKQEKHQIDALNI